jgi:hypothetical protein
MTDHCTLVVPAHGIVESLLVIGFGRDQVACPASTVSMLRDFF